MNPSWTDICEALAAVASAIVSFVGFLFVVIQLRQNQNSIDGQTHAQVYQLNQGIYNMLIEHPDLRPYFYENKDMPIDEPERSKVLAAAELLADLFEYVVLNEKSLNAEIRDSWLEYMRLMYHTSQCLRDFLASREASYSARFLEIIGHYQRRMSLNTKEKYLQIPNLKR